MIIDVSQARDDIELPSNVLGVTSLTVYINKTKTFWKKKYLSECFYVILTISNTRFHINSMLGRNISHTTD